MKGIYENYRLRKQLFSCFIDKGGNPGYTFVQSQLKNRVCTIVLSGLFCRGLLPEYQWMNIPEAFLWSRLWSRFVYRKFFGRKSL